MFAGQWQKNLGDEAEPGCECRNGQEDQGRDHDPWRFATGARVLAASFTEEDDHDQTHHIERGQESREQPQPKNGAILLVSDCEDCVLAEESAEGGKADQGERSDHESQKGDPQPAGESAHLPDVLFVMEHDDDRTGPEEEERLEERVGKEMEHRRFA